MVTPPVCWISGFSCSNKKLSCQSEPLHSVVCANQNMTGSASKQFRLLFRQSKRSILLMTTVRTYWLNNKGLVPHSWLIFYHPYSLEVRSFRKWFAIILLATQKTKWWLRIDYFATRLFFQFFRGDKWYSSCFAGAWIRFIAWGDQATFSVG